MVGAPNRSVIVSQLWHHIPSYSAKLLRCKLFMNSLLNILLIAISP